MKTNNMFVNVITKSQEDALAVTMHNIAVLQADQVLACQACGATLLYDDLLGKQYIKDANNCPNCGNAKMDECAL